VIEAIIHQDIQQRRDGSPGVSVNGEPISKTAGMGGGAFDGASRTSRELGTWDVRVQSADSAINRDKLILDARANDLARNVGPIAGARSTHKNSIVGAYYRLNADPVLSVLRRIDKRFDETWSQEFQEEVEELASLYYESDHRYVDVQERLTLTELIRLAVGVYFNGGEVLATMNWMRGGGRPFSTSMQLVDCDRLSNPYDGMDTATLRRGVVLNANGAPIGFQIRDAHPTDFGFGGKGQFEWTYRAKRLRWGRLNTLHIMEPDRPDQNRGVSALVAVLKETRMAGKFHDTALANAIVQASYAAAIESELPPEMAFELIGAQDKLQADRLPMMMGYLNLIAEYSRGSRNLEIDGTKIPYLPPGSKLKMTPAGAVSGIGEKLEESLHRHIAAALDISYEEYSRDYSKTNYSSAKAAANNTVRAMAARKRVIADRVANEFHACWMEEAVNDRRLESMRNIVASNPDLFYLPMVKEALCNATWIGSSRHQVDEMKETQAAALRIANGTSTLEAENAQLGRDWRKTLRQKAREQKLAKELGVELSTQATKPGTLNNARGNNAQNDNEENADE
jgi:lambda family phage portal protein